MAKYPVSTLVRAAVAVVMGAAGAAVTGGHGDLGVLDLGQWLTVIGTGLVAGGALLTAPSKPAVNARSVASVQDVVSKTAEAHETLTKQAVDSIERVKAAVGDLTALLPGVPPVTALAGKAAEVHEAVEERVKAAVGDLTALLPGVPPVTALAGGPPVVAPDVARHRPVGDLTRQILGQL